MDGVVEKTIKPTSSEDAIITLLLIKDFIGRVSCPIELKFPALCASPFFPMTRPPAQGVENLRQPELGACILDACALKNSSERPTTKNKLGGYSPLVGRETTTPGRGCPLAMETEKCQNPNISG